VTAQKPLIVHIVFRFDYGGLENGVVNVVNGLVNGRFRHAIVALTESTDFSRRLNGNVPVYALHKRPGKDLGCYWRLFRLLRRLRPAVVHTRNVGTLDCAAVAFLAGVPTRIHGEHGWDVSDPDGANPKFRLLRQVLSRFVKTFVTVSHDLYTWLVTAVGIPAQKVTRICNGVDTTKFRPPHANESRSMLPADVFGPNSVVVGSVTRFAPIKDPLNLVRAFIRLQQRGTATDRLRLLMIGDGELRPEALRLLESEGLASTAWLPGSRSDVPELLRSMDVFVLGSLREGISNTVLEAMASGVPVVATATGGNVELVAPNETGILVAPGDSAALADAIGAYFDSEDLRRRHGREARARVVANYSIAAMLEQYRNLYDDAVVTMEA
jgi:sugar transferase (PEP-CTERM/EpsH1 system associated)